MKSISKTLMALSMTVAMYSAANAADTRVYDNQPAPEREVVVGFNDAYVPGGFDAGSDVFVVSHGIFPNGCYKWKRADVRHLDQYTHTVTGVAGVSQGMCLMVLVPFTKEVHLGRLGSGQHTIRMMNGDGTFFDKHIVIE